MSAVPAVVGTLLGTLLGSILTYLAQARLYRRESAERLADLRRTVYVEWLEDVHSLRRELRDVLVERRGSQSDAELRAAVRALGSDAGQLGLEQLRLVASNQVAEAAAGLWRHMRRHPFAQGLDTTHEAWQQWNDEYWQFRRELIDAARSEFEVEPLDWDKASVALG